MFGRSGLAVLAVVLPMTSGLPAQADSPGEREYMTACASCHGADATGAGPMAQFLNVEVPDLTALSARNEGTFPLADVLAMVDGRACGPSAGNRPCPRPSPDLRGHTRAMPVWGNRYMDEAVFDDPAAPGNPEIVVLGRMLALAYYLESVQK
jgi:mono/diheme cytochrome c family protein